MKLALVALLVAAHVASANGFGYDDYDQTLPHCNSYSEGFLGRLMKQNAACSCNDGERKVDSGRRSWIKSKTVQVFENALVDFQTFARGDIYVKSGNLGSYFVCRNHRQALDLIIRDYDPSPEEGEKLADHIFNVLAKGSKPHMHRVFKSRRLTRRLTEYLYNIPNPRSSGIYDDYDQTLPNCNKKYVFDNGDFNIGLRSKSDARCSCNDGEKKVTTNKFQDILVRNNPESGTGYDYVGKKYVCRTAEEAVTRLVIDYDLNEDERFSAATHLWEVTRDEYAPTRRHRRLRSLYDEED